MSLNQHQKDLLIGTLLGDGNLQTESNGRNWRYRALHTNEHKQYVDHKYEVLKPLCGSPPIYGKIYDKRTNKYYERMYFNTLSSSLLNDYAKLFYKFNYSTLPNSTISPWQKVVPQNIESLLTPRAVAYWYMDDGALKWKFRSNGMRICTESFREEEVELLQKALKKLYNIETSLNRKTANGLFIGYRLGINEKNATPFRELIQPYLVDCMRYKVSDGNRGHL